jgi:hypothetical protein
MLYEILYKTVGLTELKYILTIEKLCPTDLNNDQHFQNNASLILQAIVASLHGKKKAENNKPSLCVYDR